QVGHHPSLRHETAYFQSVNPSPRFLPPRPQESSVSPPGDNDFLSNLQTSCCSHAASAPESSSTNPPPPASAGACSSFTPLWPALSLCLAEARSIQCP